jgi:hypothetical protein
VKDFRDEPACRGLARSLAVAALFAVSHDCVGRQRTANGGVPARLKKGDRPLCPPPAITKPPAGYVSGQRSQSPFLRRQ